jgi:hypothetical protein
LPLPRDHLDIPFRGSGASGIALDPMFADNAIRL